VVPLYPTRRWNAARLAAASHGEVQPNCHVALLAELSKSDHPTGSEVSDSSARPIVMMSVPRSARLASVTLL
jgi:hypothetical protein